MADDDEKLPRSALNKLIRDAIPNVRVGNETRDVVFAACMEFIKGVSAEANRLCEMEQKKTIAPEHVLKALENLGFGAEYQEIASSVLSSCQEVAARRLKRQNSRLDRLGIPEEELLRQQQELIDKAKRELNERENAEREELMKMLREHNGTATASHNLPLDPNEDYDVE